MADYMPTFFYNFINSATIIVTKTYFQNHILNKIFKFNISPSDLDEGIL